MTGTLPGLDGRVFDAVLFDLDSTLVDSTAAVRRSWLSWAAEYDVDPQRLLGWHGVPSARIVAALVPVEHYPAASARIVELEVSDTEGVVVLPGARRALTAVPPGRAAIVTSCTRALADARIGAAGLAVPAVVVTADDVEDGKPDPAPYLLAAEQLRVAPGRCLVVEDAPQGLQSAHAAGCTVLAVTTTSPAEELPAAAVVTTLADVRIEVGVDGVAVHPA